MGDEYLLDGVSPVIGVVLIVAITVIIAATLGVAFFGFGGLLEETSSSTSQSSVIVDGNTVTLISDSNKQVEVKDKDGNTVGSLNNAGDTVNLPAGQYNVVSGDKVLKEIDVGLLRAEITSDKYDGYVMLSGSTSYSQTEIKSYEWVVDGNSYTGEEINVSVSGAVDVKLTVTDSRGGTDTTSTVVGDSGTITINDDTYKNEPNTYPTVQQGLDNSSNGDTIIIKEGKDGKYSGFTINNKNTEIVSEEDVTITSTIYGNADDGGGIDIMINDITIDTSDSVAYSTNTDTEFKDIEITSGNSHFIDFTDTWEQIYIENSRILESSVSFRRHSDVFASSNWWGSSDGPPQNVRINNRRYTWDRWCTNKECSQLSKVRLTDGGGNGYTTVQGAIDDGSTTINLESRDYEGFRVMRLGTTITGTGSDTVITSTVSSHSNDGGGVDIWLEDLKIATDGSTAYSTGIDTEMNNVIIDSSNSKFVNFKDSYEHVYINNSKILESSVSFRRHSDVHAKYNWWGDSNGPPDSVKGYNARYDWDRWCTDEDCTQFSEIRLTDGNGNGYTTVQGALDDGSKTINLESRDYEGFHIHRLGTTITGTGSDTVITDTVTSHSNDGGGVDIWLEDLKIATDGSTAYSTGIDTEMNNVVIDSSNSKFVNFKDSYEHVYINKSKIYSTDVNFAYKSDVHAKYNWWGSSDGPPQSVKDVGSSRYSWDPYCTDEPCDNYSN